MIAIHLSVLDRILFFCVRAARPRQLVPRLLENDDLRHGVVATIDLECARPSAADIARQGRSGAQQNKSNCSFHSALLRLNRQQAFSSGATIPVTRWQPAPAR